MSYFRTYTRKIVFLNNMELLYQILSFIRYFTFYPGKLYSCLYRKYALSWTDSFKNY